MRRENLFSMCRPAVMNGAASSPKLEKAMDINQPKNIQNTVH
jgi:hypothetical protein